MGKIFEFQAYKGSLIDSCSNTISEDPVDFSFGRKEKGLAGLFNGATSQLNWLNVNLAEIDSGYFSCECWFYAKSNGDNNEGTLIDTGSSGWRITLSAAYRIYAYRIGNTAFTDADTYELNKWHHIIFSCDPSGAVSICLDGVVLDLADSITETTSSPNILRIGHRGGIREWDGYVGRVQIYNHILTSEERAKLYKEFLQASPITKTIR